MADVEIAGGLGSARLRGYLARPSGAGPWPGVVMVHEALGLNAMMRRQADRLANAGYLVLAPDLFSDGGAGRCLIATFRAMFTGQGKAIADIEAARAHLAADPRCTAKVGVLGFCMGGGFALLTAARGFDVASANYGVVPHHAGQALAGACPIVGSYGGKDVSLPGAAAKLERALTGLGIEHDIAEYPTAGHSFLNDAYIGPGLAHPIQRIAHVGPDPIASQAAWQRIEAFFARHLQ